MIYFIKIYRGMRAAAEIFERLEQFQREGFEVSVRDRVDITSLVSGQGLLGILRCDEFYAFQL